MTSRSLNSGALNVTPFPSSEQGASVIELMGEITVGGTIGGISLLLTASATSQPRATCTASSKLNIGVQAAVSPSAGSVGVEGRSRIMFGGSTTCSASASVTSINVKSRASAATQASAASAAQVLMRVTRSASIFASAITTSSTLKRVPMEALVKARANVGLPVALSKVPLAAKQAVTAAPRGSITFRSQLSASTDGTAIIEAGVQSWISFSAPTVAGAAGMSTNVGVRLAAIATVPVAADGLCDVILRCGVKATSSARAECLATNKIKITLQATTTAQAVAYSAAADFSVTLPAPPERQIVVPPYDRTMKVVA